MKNIQYSRFCSLIKGKKLGVIDTDELSPEDFEQFLQNEKLSHELPFIIKGKSFVGKEKFGIRFKTTNYGYETSDCYNNKNKTYYSNGLSFVAYDNDRHVFVLYQLA